MDVSIDKEAHEGNRHVTKNHKMAQLYLEQSRELGMKSGLKETDGLLTSILGFPEVLKTERPELGNGE